MTENGITGENPRGIIVDFHCRVCGTLIELNSVKPSTTCRCGTRYGFSASGAMLADTVRGRRRRRRGGPAMTTEKAGDAGRIGRGAAGRRHTSRWQIAIGRASRTRGSVWRAQRMLATQRQPQPFRHHDELLLGIRFASCWHASPQRRPTVTTDLTPERRITLRQTAGHYQQPHALSTERYLADCLDEALDALDAKDREIADFRRMSAKLAKRDVTLDREHGAGCPDWEAMNAIERSSP